MLLTFLCISVVFCHLSWFFVEVDHDILESVDSVQEAIDSLNKKASVEILKVEQKFNKLRKPHYDHRAELLAKIPNFWLTVFMNHVQLRKLITQDDEKILSFLKAVEVQEFDDITSGYKINFVSQISGR